MHAGLSGFRITHFPLSTRRVSFTKMRMHRDTGRAQRLCAATVSTRTSELRRRGRSAAQEWRCSATNIYELPRKVISYWVECYGLLYRQWALDILGLRDCFYCLRDCFYSLNCRTDTVCLVSVCLCTCVVGSHFCFNENHSRSKAPKSD